jgi:hypothetical protein
MINQIFSIWCLSSLNPVSKLFVSHQFIFQQRDYQLNDWIFFKLGFLRAFLFKFVLEEAHLFRDRSQHLHYWRYHFYLILTI